MTIAGAPLRGYRFEKATGDTPVHRWTRDQMEAAFFVDLTSETIIVALLRRSGQNSETSSVKLPFQQIREIVRNAEHARTVDVLAVHGGGPGDTVTHGRMILIVLPAGLAPQTPAVLFSDLRLARR
jgi:hypothetical protein